MKLPPVWDGMKIGGDYMRLIDADALKPLLREYCVDDDEVVMKWYDIMGVDEVIDRAPTIDAVPVVRCKGCKRRMSAAKNGRVYWDGYEYYCGIAHYGVTDDGFCFYGERKDDD